MLLVNFKTYPEVTGDASILMAKTIHEAATRENIAATVCVQAVDVRSVLKEVQIPVWAQHVDVYSEGQSTGWLPPQIAKNAGYTGTLLNHSEHKLEKHMLQEIVKVCKQVGLQTLIFAASQEEALEVSKFEPDYIGYEPPELVGSTKTSVAESRPETIRKVVDLLPNTKVLVGAGIKSTQDVRVSLQLGAVGVAVSSAVVLAQDPMQKVEELLDGFK